MVTKEQFESAVKKQTRQVFHMVDRETGVNTYLDISAMKEWCVSSGATVHRIPVQMAMIERMVEDNSINHDRLKRMRWDPCLDPIILIRFGATEPPVVTIADGRHRYCIAYADNLRKIGGYIVEEKDWRRFVLDGPTQTLDEFIASPPG